MRKPPRPPRSRQTNVVAATPYWRRRYDMALPSDEKPSSSLYKGVSEKFAEGFGSALAYGIIAVIVLLINKFLISPEGPIVRYSDKARPTKEHGDNMIVEVPCNDNEIALGGQCVVGNGSIGRFALQNFGPSDDSTTFHCNWKRIDFPRPATLIPNVKAACVDKTKISGLQVFIGK